MKRIYQISLSIALSLGIAALATAATYKWVDKDGNVHYSQQAPADANYEKLNIKVPRSSGGAEPDSSSDNSASTGSSDSSSSAVVKQETAKAEEQRRRNCEAAKKNLELYTVFRRVKDKNGNVVRLDDNERAKRIDDSKAAIKEFCE